MSLQRAKSASSVLSVFYFSEMSIGDSDGGVLHVALIDAYLPLINLYPLHGKISKLLFSDFL